MPALCQLQLAHSAKGTVNEMLNVQSIQFPDLANFLHSYSQRHIHTYSYVNNPLYKKQYNFCLLRMHFLCVMQREKDAFYLTMEKRKVRKCHKDRRLR